MEKDEGVARTGAIAEMMDVKPPTVTEMLQKLKENGQVDYRIFQGAKLTEKGVKAAKELMGRHATIAGFLKLIGVDNKLADEDACILEHHISQETMIRLEKFMEFAKEGPDEPRWLSHFRHFCKTGEREKCDHCMGGKDNPDKNNND